MMRKMGWETSGRKGDDTYSRDWRTKLPWVKLKTRAWITRNMPAGVSFKSLRLYRRKVGQGDLGRNNSEGNVPEDLESLAGFNDGDKERDRGVAEGIV